MPEGADSEEGVDRVNVALTGEGKTALRNLRRRRQRTKAAHVNGALVFQDTVEVLLEQGFEVRHPQTGEVARLLYL